MFVVVGALTWVGVLLTTSGIRPTAFVSFRTDAGMVALDGARAGPDVEEFDDFVELLIDHIRAARAPAASDEPLG